MLRRGMMMRTGAQSARVAVGQMTSTSNVLDNYETCARLARQAKDAGCSLLALPECFSFIGSTGEESLAQAEPLSGPKMARYRALARETGLWLSLGGFQEASDTDPSRYYNAHVVLDDQGAVRAHYRKVHLFDVDVPGGPVLMESQTTLPGDLGLVSCDSPVGKLGVTVCYDLRFPAVYERLRFDHGAQVMTVPSAFTRPTGAAHWEVLLRARAIESQCFVLAAAQAGVHNDRRQSYGHAMVVGPWGVVVAKVPEGPDATGIAVADIDIARLNAIRASMPIEQHRARARDQVVAPKRDTP